MDNRDIIWWILFRNGCDVVERQFISKGWWVSLWSMLEAGRVYPGGGSLKRFVKVLKLWYFAKSDHKNVKLASLKQCHFYAQHKIPEPKYFHEPLQASPSRIHPPRLQHTPQTHSPTLWNKLSLHHIATIPKKYPPYYISIIHFFPLGLPLVGHAEKMSELGWWSYYHRIL